MTPCFNTSIISVRSAISIGWYRCRSLNLDAPIIMVRAEAQPSRERQAVATFFKAEGCEGPATKDAKPASRPAYSILIDTVNDSFVSGPDENILLGMIAKGHSALPVGCRNGGCGVCRITVISGDYDSLPMSRSRVSADEEAQGVALACRVFPRSDMIVRPYPLPRHNWAGQ